MRDAEGRPVTRDAPPDSASSFVGSLAGSNAEDAKSPRAPNEGARPRLTQHGEHHVDKGGKDMVDPEKRNGAESAGRLEKERERLEREREAGKAAVSF